MIFNIVYILKFCFIGRFFPSLCTTFFLFAISRDVDFVLSCRTSYCNKEMAKHMKDMTRGNSA